MNFSVGRAVLSNEVPKPPYTKMRLRAPTLQKWFTVPASWWISASIGTLTSPTTPSGPSSVWSQRTRVFVPRLGITGLSWPS